MMNRADHLALMNKRLWALCFKCSQLCGNNLVMAPFLQEDCALILAFENVVWVILIDLKSPDLNLIYLWDEAEQRLRARWRVQSASGILVKNLHKYSPKPCGRPSQKWWSCCSCTRVDHCQIKPYGLWMGCHMQVTASEYFWQYCFLFCNLCWIKIKVMKKHYGRCFFSCFTLIFYKCIVQAMCWLIFSVSGTLSMCTGAEIKGQSWFATHSALLCCWFSRWNAFCTHATSQNH